MYIYITKEQNSKRNWGGSIDYFFNKNHSALCSCFDNDANNGQKTDKRFANKRACCNLAYFKYSCYPNARYIFAVVKWCCADFAFGSLWGYIKLGNA